MSDYLHFDPETKILTVPTDKGSIEGNPANSTVYMHPFEFRGADHIFVETGESDEQVLGAFIFRTASDLLMDNFDNLVGQLVKAEFSLIVADEVADCDWQQFERTTARFFDQVNMSDLETPWVLGEQDG